MEVVHNPEAEAWLNNIGQRLAKTPEANAYPYYFKLVNDQSINAFALPGGPMFVHTGLIDAADDEDQVAGVLAHEMSHVALRHGANQMSKQQTWQTIMGVVGAAAGMTGGGECGLLCQAIQMGGGLTQNAVLMRFSRDHERDADLNGARMMAAAGYNPLELAHFFEKIQAEQGTSAAPKGLASFLSDHPNPGNRIQYIEDDIQFYPKRPYNASTGEFTRIKQICRSVAAAQEEARGALAAGAGAGAPGIAVGLQGPRNARFRHRLSRHLAGRSGTDRRQHLRRSARGRGQVAERRRGVDPRRHARLLRAEERQAGPPGYHRRVSSVLEAGRFEHAARNPKAGAAWRASRG